MALAAALPFQVGLVSSQAAYTDIFLGTGRLLPTLPQLLWEFIFINLVLMLFNLIPLAPLDGDKIAQYFLPPSWADTFERIRPYGPLILMLLFIGGPILGVDILGWILGPPLQFLIGLLVG
jgi:Zn-dependent protease